MTKLKQQSSTNVVLHPATAPPRGRRAEDKWSKQVMKFGYTTVPNLLLRVQGKLGISPNQFNVLLHLIEHWWDAEKDPYPGKDTIARRMGKSSRMIQRYVGELEDMGYIKRKARFTGLKSQTTNTYSLDGLIRKLKQLEPEFTKAENARRIRQQKLETAAVA